MPASERMTTQLEAINDMLACVGETPIASLTGDLPASVQIAVNKLKSTSREVQARAWNFNSEDDYEITLDVDGYANLPGNVLDCDIHQENGSVDIVQRGLSLYDKKNHTLVFESNPTVDLVLFLAWDNLSEPARNYIKIRAARIYQDQTVGSQEHHLYSSADEEQALIDLNTSDMRNEDATIFDTYEMFSIVNRRRPRITSF